MKHYSLPYGYTKKVNENALFRVNDKCFYLLEPFFNTIYNKDYVDKYKKAILESTYQVTQSCITITEDTVKVSYELNNIDSKRMEKKYNIETTCLTNVTPKMMYTEFDNDSPINIEFDAYELGTTVYTYSTVARKIISGTLEEILVIANNNVYDRNDLDVTVIYYVRNKDGGIITVQSNSPFITSNKEEITTIMNNVIGDLLNKINELKNECDNLYERLYD